MFTTHKFKEGDSVIYQAQRVVIAGYGVNHLGLKCGESTPDEIVVIEFESSTDSKPRLEVCEHELELIKR
jgi:hypothetical protein